MLLIMYAKKVNAAVILLLHKPNVTTGEFYLGVIVSNLSDVNDYPD
jgi:hypothetical protein